MKITYATAINYFDVDADFKIPPSKVFQLLQEAAITHSETVGFGITDLVRDGLGWVLNKIDLEILQYPEYLENVEVTTWSRGIRGVKGLREFEIHSGTEKMAAASSVWVFFDIWSGKIKRVSKEMDDIYTVDTETALNQDLEKWKAPKEFQLDFKLPLSIRYADYDPLGHINNCIYIHYIETLLFRMLGPEGGRIKRIKIQYHREIGKHSRMVEGGLSQSGENWLFKIYDLDALYTSGEVTLGSF